MALPASPSVAPTETTPDADREPRAKPRALEPYKVILHNDDHNTMDHVVRSLVRSVPGLGLKKAFHIMLEAHEMGKAIVKVCPLELAELYRDRLQSCGLTATVEAG